MKLSNVIAVWDKLHVKDTGELGYCDLEKAIEDVVGIKNDVPQLQRPLPPTRQQMAEAAQASKETSEEAKERAANQAANQAHWNHVQSVRR